MFTVLLKLPPGTHRMRFVVDNELRCSDTLPSATDSMGNLVNYIEVGLDAYNNRSSLQDANAWQLEQVKRKQEAQRRDHTDVISDQILDNADDIAALSGGGYERFTEEPLPDPVYVFSTDIPRVFSDPDVMDQFVASDFVTPPSLPPHLESVILNSNSNEKDNNSVLPIPNHVVLNHLATTSIKHNVLAVASISRYKRKYVTQILYAPL